MKHLHSVFGPGFNTPALLVEDVIRRHLFPVISATYNVTGSDLQSLENVAPEKMTLEQFLIQVEKRAFRMAHIATSDSEEALDIVQDAMLVLTSKYSTRSADEWPPLFHRILQNRIRDWYRRQKVRNTWLKWFGQNDNEEDELQNMQDPASFTPERLLQSDHAVQQLETALHTLPLRQQQTFLLRAWEGLDVKETAEAMGISAGSVKTHYSRALHTLRQLLGESGDE